MILDQKTELNKTKKILFFTSSLSGGGAEMHLLRVTNYLDRRQFKISLALAKSGGSYESFLESDVNVNYLLANQIPSSTARMLLAIQPLRSLIKREKPDIICSVLDHASLSGFIATQGLLKPPKIVVCVQNPPSINYSNPWHPINRLILSLIPRLYPKADRIIALSQGVAEDLQELVPTISDRISIIYNAGVDDRVINQSKEPIPEEKPRNVPLIVACGRLTEQKGFPYLIEAMAKVRQHIPAHLWILGEGKLRPQLERQIQQLGLSDCVRLLGFKNNPYQYMATADVFVLSSLYEGFGNVIVEAMACGTPVIATDCPYGPGEILTNNVNGLLVPIKNVLALSDAIIELLSRPEHRQKLSEHGQQRADSFHARTIADKYGQLFQNLLTSQFN